LPGQLLEGSDCFATARDGPPRQNQTHRTDRSLAVTAAAWSDDHRVQLGVPEPTTIDRRPRPRSRPCSPRPRIRRDITLTDTPTPSAQEHTDPHPGILTTLRAGNTAVMRPPTGRRPNSRDTSTVVLVAGVAEVADTDLAVLAEAVHVGEEGADVDHVGEGRAAVGQQRAMASNTCLVCARMSSPPTSLTVLVQGHLAARMGIFFVPPRSISACSSSRRGRRSTGRVVEVTSCVDP